MLAGTIIEGVALAYVRSVDMGSATHCDIGHDSWVRCTGLFSLGRQALSQTLWWRERHVRALI